MGNIDQKVVSDFGNEWEKYNQSSLSESELKTAFDQYFGIFPFDKIDETSVGFDMGCGSGRWAKLIANKVGTLNCIDPSQKAIQVAKINLSEFSNVNFIRASVDEGVLEEASQDFGYCLGVLHHAPDTLSGLRSCSKLLKRGAPFLLYLYYNFETKPIWFRLVWRASDIIRRVISVLPFSVKKFVTFIIAIFVYLPLARFSLFMERLGVNVSNIPLSDYRNKSFYFMRTDALDRFGTRLEKRFSRKDISSMLESVGFERIRFSNSTPFWVVVAYKV